MPKKTAYSPKNPRRKGLRCTVCQHAERERVELLSVGGASLESLASKFGLSKDSVHRHMRNHVAPETKEALAGGPAYLNKLAERAARENMSVLDYLQILRSTLMRQLTNCNIADDSFSTSRLASTLLAVLQEIGRMTGEITKLIALHLHQHGSTVILNSPEVLRLQAAILTALQTHPEARRDVIIALRELESAEAPKAMNHAMLAPPREIEAVANV